MFKNILIRVCALLALAACSRPQQAPPRTPQPSDSLYTARAAMQVYGTQPEWALRIVDSALVVGNLSPFQADFLRAKIYAATLEDPQPDKAIALCEVLLQHDSTQVVNEATAINRSNVLEVIMGACRQNQDYEHWLQYAVELSGLSRSRGMEVESLRMEAEIGAVLARLGRMEEGMGKLDQVIYTLGQGEPSVDRMDAGIVALKRRIIVLDKAGRYHDIIPDAEAIIAKLDDYQRHPSDYAEDSFRLPPDGENHAKYCQFYKAQAQAYLANAFVTITPPDLTKARQYAHEAEASAFGRSFTGRWTLAPVWKALGQWDKLLAIDAEVDRRMGTDTLNADYAIVLKDRADAATARGQYPQALSYLNRYADLQDQLNTKRHETEAQEYAARYHALEQEQEIREAKAQSARKDNIILIIALAMLIVVAFSFFSVRQRRSIVAKNHALVRMIREQQAAKTATQEQAPKPDRELFNTIDKTIREEKLYTNINLQRQDIVDRFNIGRHSLNELFSAYADGQSFTTYINNMRMRDAIFLLQEDKDLSISEIADAVGFTPANFREQFKRQYGMTPTEYRQHINGKK